MNKKGQVTIFILAGIIIIFIMGLFIYFRFYIIKSSIFSEETRGIVVPQQLKAVKNSIDECLEDTSKDAVLDVLRHGGYHNLQENSFDYLTDSLPYYYVNGRKSMPSIGEIENELASYINDNIDRCLDFNELRTIGFKIEYTSYTVSTALNGENVEVSMNFPVFIEKDETSVRLELFKVRVDADINRLYDAASRVVESYLSNPGAVCLTCIEAISASNRVEIKSAQASLENELGDNVIWFLIKDLESMIDGKEIVMRFVVEK